MPCAIWGYLEESQQKVILNIKFSLSRKWGAKCWEKDPSEDLRYYYCAKFHSSRSQTRRALIQVWMKYIQVAMLSRDFTAWNISLLLDAVVSSVHFCAYYAHSSQSKTKQCALNQVWKKNWGRCCPEIISAWNLIRFPFVGLGCQNAVDAKVLSGSKMNIIIIVQIRGVLSIKGSALLNFDHSALKLWDCSDPLKPEN